MTQKSLQKKPMTHRTQSKQIEGLANEAAKLTTKEETALPNELMDLVKSLSAQNEVLKEEMQELQSRITKTISNGSNELKSEIAQKPLQSVFAALAIGFVISAVLRR